MAALRPHCKPSTQANATPSLCPSLSPSPSPAHLHQENQMKAFISWVFLSDGDGAGAGRGETVARHLPMPPPALPRLCQLIPALGALVLTALGTPRQRYPRPPPTTSSPRMTALGAVPSTGMCWRWGEPSVPPWGGPGAAVPRSAGPAPAHICQAPGSASFIFLRLSRTRRNSGRGPGSGPAAASRSCCGKWGAGGTAMGPSLGTLDCPHNPAIS